jgi:hypothetical protein
VLTQGDIAGGAGRGHRRRSRRRVAFLRSRTAASLAGDAAPMARWATVKRRAESPSSGSAQLPDLAADAGRGCRTAAARFQLPVRRGQTSGAAGPVELPQGPDGFRPGQPVLPGRAAWPWRRGARQDRWQLFLSSPQASGAVMMLSWFPLPAGFGGEMVIDRETGCAAVREASRLVACQRRGRKKSRSSPTSINGCSRAGKCPPRSSSFQ